MGSKLQISVASVRRERGYGTSETSIVWSGPKFYGTLQNELKYLFVSCVVFSFIDTPASLKPLSLSVLDESESAEIWGKGKFKNWCTEKEKWNLRICLTWNTAIVIDLWKEASPLSVLSWYLSLPSLFVSHSARKTPPKLITIHKSIKT